MRCVVGAGPAKRIGALSPNPAWSSVDSVLPEVLTTNLMVSPKVEPSSAATARADPRAAVSDSKDPPMATSLRAVPAARPGAARLYGY